MTKPRFNTLAFITVLLAFFSGLGIGILYMRQIMAARIDMERMYTSIMRFQDWNRFAEHVRQDNLRPEKNSAPFPSNTMLSNPVAVASFRTAQSLDLKVGKPKVVKKDGIEAVYSAEVILANHKDNNEGVHPANILIEDQTGKRFGIQKSVPPLPPIGIPGGIAETFQVSYVLPIKSIATKLVVISDSGTAVASIR